MAYKIPYVLIAMVITFSSPAFINEAVAGDDVEAAAVHNLDEFFNNDTLIVEDTDLGEMRGTALDPEVLGVALFDAISVNNSANGTVSGGNVINDGAFSGSSGLSTIIQNSGNNVLIQSATILNLNIE